MKSRTAPYFVRRARLLLGMTQRQFAEQFDVDDGTVSRWELGKLQPGPKAWQKIQAITTKHGSLLADKAVRASPVYKFITPMDNLRTALVVSRGAFSRLSKVGITLQDLSNTPLFGQNAMLSRHYEESAYKALLTVEADPKWLAGEIVYAEAHCIATRLNQWIDLMLAPLPDTGEALIEATLSENKGGYWVKLTYVDRPPAMIR
ncbi:MAG: helix-turn-helix transcriptional regulator [Rhodomicrobium sp.]